MTKTAIILFANLPDIEAREKSFCGLLLQKANRKISSVLTQHFYSLAKQSTAETFLMDTYRQTGRSFGEKIANAFADIFSRGYENIVCIGNDCPDLSLQRLQHSVIAVEAGNVVLGPTFDGGAYLIGIPKHKFNQQYFQQIKWQSKQTLESLKALFNNDEVELDFLADIDHAKGFSLSANNSPLVRQIVNIIKGFKVFCFVNLSTAKPTFFLVDRSFLKGPPLFFV